MPAGDPEGGRKEVSLLGRETLWPYSVIALPRKQGTQTTKGSTYVKKKNKKNAIPDF